MGLINSKPNFKQVIWPPVSGDNSNFRPNNDSESAGNLIVWKGVQARENCKQAPA